MQAWRITEARARWKHACAPGYNFGEPTCLGNSDGTWFRTFDPLNASTWFPGQLPATRPEDVRTPWASWKEAVVLSTTTLTEAGASLRAARSLARTQTG